MLRLGVIGMFSGLAIAASTAVIAGLEEYYPNVGGLIPLVSGIGAVLLFVGLGLMTLSRLWPEASPPRSSSEPTALPQTQPMAKLPPARQPEPMSSVTEHTTELLQTSEAPTPARTTVRQGE
jgi:hypothetical protein